MLSIHDSLYDINLVSVSLRIFLAFIFSGIIGLERGANRHPAGFRTYILVCIGATLAMTSLPPLLTEASIAAMRPPLVPFISRYDFLIP